MQLFAPFSISFSKKEIIEERRAEAENIVPEDYYFKAKQTLVQGDYTLTITPTQNTPEKGLHVIVRIYHQQDSENEDDYILEEHIEIKKEGEGEEYEESVVKIEDLPNGDYDVKIRVWEKSGKNWDWNKTNEDRYLDEHQASFKVTTNEDSSTGYTDNRIQFNFDLKKTGTRNNDLEARISWLVRESLKSEITGLNYYLEFQSGENWEKKREGSVYIDINNDNFKNSKKGSVKYTFKDLNEGVYRIRVEVSSYKYGDNTKENIYSQEVTIEKPETITVGEFEVYNHLKITGENHTEIDLTVGREDEKNDKLTAFVKMVLQEDVEEEETILKQAIPDSYDEWTKTKDIKSKKEEHFYFDKGSAGKEYAILIKFCKTEKTECIEEIEIIQNIKLGSDYITQNLNEIDEDNQEVNMTGSTNIDYYECSWKNLRGCFAEFTYLILFKPTAFLFGLTGKVLDFTLMYSLDDNSYRSVFVVEGWGIVRDICNLFFIFILLFVAFKVVLNLGGKGNPKSLIINIIIVGLLINFSLFATRVIIDASNILSRVFYNTEVINIGSQNKTKGNFNEIRLSEALVSKVNPQELILKANRLEENSTKSTQYESNARSVGKLPISLGGFILVCILAGAICIIGSYVFFKIAILFIVRVVMLWMAMILSPISFFSYTLPELASLPMVGHKNWWRETVSLAFMAPIFCFFMYVIISFLETGLALIEQNSGGGIAGGFDFVISIVVPFGFLIVLLIKAKEIAETMAGKVGEMASKAVTSITKTVGGATVGLAAGGAAMAMRGTIGAMGARMASSERLTKMEDKGGFQGFLGRNLRNVGIGMGNKSYDIRNTSLGKKAGEGLGISKSMKGPLSSRSKQGVGIVGNREENLKRMEKREADRDKFRPKTKEEKEKDDLIEQQVVLENKNAEEIEKKEREMEKAKEELGEKDAELNRKKDNKKAAEEDYKNSIGTADQAEKKRVFDEAKKEEDAARKERNEAAEKVNNISKEISRINHGGETVVEKKDSNGNVVRDSAGNTVLVFNEYNTTNGNITQEMYDDAQKKRDEAIAEEATALVEKQKLEGEQGDKELEVGVERMRKIAKASLNFDEQKQKAEEKRDNAVTLAEQSFDKQIQEEELKLNDPSKTDKEKAEITKKISDLQTNKTNQISSIKINAEKEYKEAITQITKNRDDQVAQAEKEAKEKKQAIRDAVAAAGTKYTEAQAKVNSAKDTFKVAEDAKIYAENNGGLGKSNSKLKEEVRDLDNKINRDTNARNIDRAQNTTPGSWILTEEQIRARRARLINSTRRNNR